MVATQALISLCVVGLSSAVNQQVIVSDVVSALQPSIARAVAQALQGVGSRGGSTFSSTSSTGFASGSRFTGTGLSGSTGSISGSVGVSGGAGAAVAEVTARPEYNFQYQVSDDIDQTYITQNEARDGDDVTGTYSYVDSNGDLITVNYQAGANGYMQTLEKQVGAVEMRARPVKVQSAQAVQSVQSGSQASRASASTGRFQSGSSNSFRSSSASSAASGAVGVDQSALIRQILAVLQPQISVAVNSAVSTL